MGDQVLWICAAVIVGIVLILGVIRMAMWLQWFRKELTYLDKEIARTTGDEQKHWIKRKKRLWRSLIPFVGY